MLNNSQTVLIMAAVMVMGAIALPFGAAGSAIAQETATVVVETPDSVDEGETIDGGLDFESVTDQSGVGSFTVNVTYNESVVSLNGTVDSASEFEIRTAKPEAGVLRVSGYISDSSGPDGTGPLADLEITGVNTTNETQIGIEIDQFTNADGDSIPVSSTGNSITVSTSSSDGGGGGGQQPGGQPAPLPDDDGQNESVDDGIDNSSGDDTVVDDSSQDDSSLDDSAEDETADDTVTEPEDDGGSSVEVPGFGMVLTVVAVLSAALLASRRQNKAD